MADGNEQAGHDEAEARDAFEAIRAGKCSFTACDADAVIMVNAKITNHPAGGLATACVEHAEDCAVTTVRTALVMAELIEPATDDERRALELAHEMRAVAENEQAARKAIGDAARRGRPQG